MTGEIAMDSNDVFWNIDNERRRRGMTIKEFCYRVGIVPQTYQNYRNHPRTIPSGVIDDIAQMMLIPRQELERGRRTI